MVIVHVLRVGFKSISWNGVAQGDIIHRMRFLEHDALCELMVDWWLSYELLDDHESLTPRTG